MSQRERDVLKVMAGVLHDQRTQVEAARLLALSERQIRRIARRLERQGDRGVVHRLRGRPGNRRKDPAFKRRVLAAYRKVYADFDPTHASQKLAAQGLRVHKETLRLWLLEAGLWQRKRRRDSHRRRRERRACRGELVQMDGSEHKWLEDRYAGPLELLAMIDDATSRVHARFYTSESTLNYMDLTRRYLLAEGRPVAYYVDRHGIFRAENALDEPQETQFSRACRELGVELILAHSPQAKGRVERLFGTLQNRWVKELRLANVRTLEAANRLLDKTLLPAFNLTYAKPPASPNDAHRPLGPAHDLDSILSLQEQRVIANDYTFRYHQRVYQVPPPALPGMRGGKVTIEERLDGTRHFRFRQAPLACTLVADVNTVAAAPALAPSPPAPPTPLSLALCGYPAGGRRIHPPGKDRPAKAGRSPAGLALAGRSGRTPALPYPPASKSCGRAKDAWRPAPSHPWR
jgi:Mn-dependent DtxR family transcriptional regulator